MYSKRNIWLAMAIVIGVGLLLGVFPTPHFAGERARDQEIQSVTEALSLYFAEHHRYPESLEVFFEQSLLQRSIQARISYAPRYDYGSYMAGYKDEQIHISFGPALSEVARNVKLRRLRGRLIQYYREHGQFPKDLHRLTLECPPGCRQVLSEGDYSYSASEDLQSFTLDGDAFGAPPPRPSLKDWGRAAKIRFLAGELHSFHAENGKYPKDLEGLANLSIFDADEFRELLEGESFVYTVSDDGKSAHLNGKDVKSIY